MTARSGDEVFEMSKNIRKKMNTIKGGSVNTEVIIQEGVPTIDKFEGNSAEPMIYMINASPVGNIYRVNDTKDHYENLNATGMGFTNFDKDENKIFCAISLVAKLASYAASWECYFESYDI